MTLGTKETYPFHDPRRSPIPRSPCGCLVSTTLPQKRNSQQYALRLHPATCTTGVQNSKACRVRLPSDLSSHQIGRPASPPRARPGPSTATLCSTRQSQKNGLFAKTTHGVIKNVPYLCKRNSNKVCLLNSLVMVLHL